MKLQNRNKISIILMILLFTFYCNPKTFAQIYNFKNFTVQDGISQSTINGIFQSSDRLLWFHTQKGIVSFNGTEFTSYSTKNGLPGNLIYFIKETAEKDILIETNEAICIFSNSKFKRITSKHRNLKISDILQLNNKEYLATSKGIIEYKNHKLYESDIKSEEIVLQFFKANENRVFAVSKSNILELTDGKFKVITEYTADPDRKIHNACLHNNELYLACDNSIKKIDLGKKVPATEIAKIAAEKITIDLSGKLWFASEKGLLGYIEKNEARIIDERNGISNLSILDIFTDDENNLWIGGRNGLTKLPLDNPFVHYNNITTSEGSIILGLYKCKNNSLWCATYGNGITVLKNNTFKPFTINFPDKHFFDICEDRNNNFIFATAYSGIVVYDTIKKQVIKKINNGRELRVFSLFKDRKGNIWAPTSGEGVIFFDGYNSKFYNKSNGLGSNKVMSVTECRNGNIWLGLIDGGISVIEGSNIHTYGKFQGFPASYIRALTCDNKGYIWAGSATHGIVRIKIKNNKTECYYINEATGLNSDNIYFLEFDKHGNLWAGTEQGLNKIHLNEKAVPEKIISYSKDDGFQYMETNINSFCEDYSGKLWFGNTNGVTMYDPEKDIKERIPVSVRLKSLKLFFEKTLWTELGFKTNNGLPVNPELSYMQNHLTFEFEGINFRSPHRVRFKFKLEGQDNEWSPETNERKVTYSNISPGKYTFYLTAKGADGTWLKEELKYSFTVLPPWWKTLWFIVICIIALTGLIILIFFLREKNLIAAKILLEKKVAERTAEVNKQKEEIISQHEFIERKNEELKAHNLEIRAINHELTSSIRYAQRIQNAILPTHEYLSAVFYDYFILYKPRDIVSGDFYWVSEVENKIVVSVADCTGHGVPGAFMSMLGSAFLNDIVKKEYITHPGVILRKLRKEIVKALHQKDSSEQFENRMKDGMDIAVVSIDRVSLEIQFAGANNPIYLASQNYENSEGKRMLTEHKGDKMPISIHDKMDRFNTSDLKYTQGDILFMFSDGIIDQFGGAKGKKFLSKNFKTVLEQNCHLYMKEQKELLEKTLDEWQNTPNGIFPQTDDITVMGIKL